MTITLDESQVERIRSLIERGSARSVSEFVLDRDDRSVLVLLAKAKRSAAPITVPRLLGASGTPIISI